MSSNSFDVCFELNSTISDKTLLDIYVEEQLPTLPLVDNDRQHTDFGKHMKKRKYPHSNKSGSVRSDESSSVAGMKTIPEEVILGRSELRMDASSVNGVSKCHPF